MFFKLSGLAHQMSTPLTHPSHWFLSFIGSIVAVNITQIALILISLKVEAKFNQQPTGNRWKPCLLILNLASHFEFYLRYSILLLILKFASNFEFCFQCCHLLISCLDGPFFAVPLEGLLIPISQMSLSLIDTISTCNKNSQSQI